MATYDEQGQRLHLLARMLTDDVELADQLVVGAVVGGRGPSEVQALSAVVYRSWADRRDRSSQAEPIDRPRADIVGQVHRLAANHRAALALCKYGDHDYRRAAVVMGLSAERVAQLLSEALWTLGSAAAQDAEPTSAA
ncbi:hypothetical protein ASD11_04420 [Aeromicrobium sp. Root495]|uniref:hypothetical protein n=1 Tax=Aeromicrobium sp. Root495 TaxID=1736550 RepID=UPI0006F372ED|nr:hypothetical protein [Aeromicrobium sp. Root495]KQY58880.1 hypothetical protein ASD11_04420 [Aeromicrobium sp. Root495]